MVKGFTTGTKTAWCAFFKRERRADARGIPSLGRSRRCYGFLSRTMCVAFSLTTCSVRRKPSAGRSMP